MIYCSECKDLCKIVKKRLGHAGPFNFFHRNEIEMISVSDCCEADTFEVDDFLDSTKQSNSYE